MFKDTIHPMRILNTLKSFLVNLGERGGVGDPEPNPNPQPQPTNWRETLPPEIKSHPALEKYKEPNEVFKAFVEAQRFLGVEKMPVPKDAADKEAYEIIFKTLGRPENPDGYVIPTDLQIPKDLPFDDALITEFKKTAHGLGILPQQFNGLYKWYITNVANQFTKMNQERADSSKQAETDLRKKWGAAYAQNTGLAKKVFQSFADEKAFAEFEKGFGNNPVLIEFFANIGKVLSEDQLSGKPSSNLIMTPAEAQSEIDKIKGDTKHPYWDAANPLHDEAVEKFTQLQRMVLGG